jgi:hypothetical protein
VRAWLADYLKPLLPEGWRPIVPNARDVDEVDAVTVVLKHVRMERLASAPLGHLRHDVVMTVISPFKAVEAAEDDLDDALTKVLTALSKSSLVTWTSADKVRTGDAWAWDINVQVLSNTDPETPEE